MEGLKHKENPFSFVEGFCKPKHKENPFSFVEGSCRPKHEENPLSFVEGLFSTGVSILWHNPPPPTGMNFTVIIFLGIEYFEEGIWNITGTLLNYLASVLNNFT